MQTLSNPLQPSPTLSPFAVPVAQGGTVTVKPRWRGRALAVHPPINNGRADVSRGVWVITHPPSGLRAGTFRGTVRDAVKLARAWDGAFADAVGNETAPTLRDWPQALAWQRQCWGDEPPTGPVSPSDPHYRHPSDAHGDNGRRIGDGTTRAVAPTLPTLPTEPAFSADGEQFPATVTIWPTTPGRARFARTVNGRARLRNPETGKPVRMNGDCAAFCNPANPTVPTLKLWFGGRWFDVPTTADLMAWSFDGACETPDGRIVEPDAPDAWLALLGVV